MAIRKSSTPRLAPLAAAVALCFSVSATAATITVSTGNLAHGFGNCTLQDAVLSIDQGSLISGTGCAARTSGSFGSNDTVLLANNVFTFSNQSAGGAISTSAASAMVLSKPMTLIGNLDPNNGQPLATINRSTSASDFRLIETSADLTLIGVEVKGGISDATVNVSGGTGGGILAVNKSTQITLTLVNSVVSGNTAKGNAAYSSYGGGIYANGADVVLRNSTLGQYDSVYSKGNSAYQGGGMDVGGGNVTLYSSTVSGNTATNGYGGGVFTSGTATITNSTFSGNYASTGGGGVYAGNGVNMKFSTFSGNTTLAGQAGGGVLIGANSTAYATLMYGNNPGNDLDATASGITVTAKYALIGTSGGNVTIGGSHNLSCNPNLSGLGNNGGPTRTMAFSAGSCAVDAGPVSTSGLASDQRGALFERRSGVATDIGAFELQPANDRIFYDGFEP